MKPTQEQVIYDILCSDEQPPEGQHWEGFVAKKIVAALAQPEQEPQEDDLSEIANLLPNCAVVRLDDKSFLVQPKTKESKEQWETRRKQIDGYFAVSQEVLAQPEQIECTPMPPVDDDGWCEWSYPIHKGYLMQCCDCGLVHEVEFHVLGNLEPQEDGSNNGEVMEDGYQVGLRMRRHTAPPQRNGRG